MSKRFGRQQKRRMRERIARLEAENQQLSALGNRNRQIVKETAEVLGRHFVTLDPCEEVVRHLDHIAHGWEVVTTSSAPHDLAWQVQDSPIDEPTFLQAVLPILRFERSSIPAQGEHFRFYYNGQQVGYAVSPAMLATMPEYMARDYIAREVANLLTCKVREG